MTGTGKVVWADDKTMTVLIKKNSACSMDCERCCACENPVYETNLKNTIGASVGDSVRIESSAKSVLAGAFMVYILPIVLVLAGYVITYEITGKSIISCIVPAFALVLWLVFIRLYDAKNKIKCEAVEIIQKSIENQIQGR